MFRAERTEQLKTLTLPATCAVYLRFKMNDLLHVNRRNFVVKASLINFQRLTVFLNCVYVLSQHIDFDPMYWCSTVLESVRFFRNNLLRAALEESGNVVLMFDGFDEISPNYEKIVISLILGNG
jgi:hypothetical protein